MPTVAPSHLYTFAALIAVSSLLTTSFIVYANTIRGSTETNRLRDLMNQVAANSIRLLTFTLSTNATTETFLQLPPRIGDKQYWFRLENDSSKSWLVGGFGNNPIGNEGLRISLIKNVSATGSYISGHGAARLTCFFNSGFIQIQLSIEGE